MIEKMKFLSITGPKADIDRVIDQYLSKYEIHLENALSELKTVASLRPYLETNPYKAELQTAAGLMANFHDTISPEETKKVSLEEAVSIVHELDTQLKSLSEQKENLEKEADTIRTSMNNVIPFTDLNYNVQDILHFKYVKFRFGRMPHEYYAKFMNYVYDTLDTVIHKCQEDAEYVWVVYFVPEVLSDKIDAIYASLHFERFFLPDEYEGTPDEATHVLEANLSGICERIREVEKQIAATLNSRKEDLAAAYQRLDTYSTNFDVRKLAACTNQKDHTFYILCGWMSESDAKAFRKELESEEETFCFVEDNHENIISKPPTKLKNPGLFKL